MYVSLPDCGAFIKDSFKTVEIEMCILTTANLIKRDLLWAIITIKRKNLELLLSNRAIACAWAARLCFLCVFVFECFCVTQQVTLSLTIHRAHCWTRLGLSSSGTRLVILFLARYQHKWVTKYHSRSSDWYFVPPVRMTGFEFRRDASEGLSSTLIRTL